MVKYVCMECPVVIGEIDAHQTIKNRGYYYPEVETCDYNETATPTKRCSGIIDTDGYCGCVCCDHMVFKGVVFHDIAVINTGNVEFAIEIINKHKTQWLINMEPAYRVYLINANNILQRISDSAVYVNSFTTPYLREPIHEKEI